MKNVVIVVLALGAAAFAANPFRPARSGGFAPQTNPEDFQLPAFRRLLLNGILWCLHDPPPPAGSP